MTVKHGKDGVVKVGSVSIAKVTRWSLSESVDVADATGMGDAAKEHEVGIPSFSGSLTCRQRKDDTTGQGALTIGASVVLNLYDDGVASGKTYHSGTASITKIDRTIDMGNVNEIAFSFEGNGALTHPTI